MGLDYRVGKRDYNVRYYLYRRDTKEINFSTIESQKAVCVVHAKDVSGYRKAAIDYGQVHRSTTTKATIETMDKVEVYKGDYLYCLATQTWYVVDETSQETVNEDQRYSSRPITKTLISIRKK